MSFGASNQEIAKHLRDVMDEMIGRGDMTDNEMVLNCVVQALAEVIERDKYDELGMAETLKSLDDELHEVLLANKENWMESEDWPK